MPLAHEQAVAILKYLAIEAIQKAQSGHPGAVLGLADIVTVLWRRWLHLSPSDPTCPHRDRFVLSNGHASALLYSLLHLRGYPIRREDLHAFRQLHAVTPGHPEYDRERGIEVTTGPLGQGFGAAVGLALAQSYLHNTHKDQRKSRTYVVVGDGCLMEGISHEVANIASSHQLDHLIVLWDDNNITIDGQVSEVSREDTCRRFEAYGWDVIGPIDGHDPEAIHRALHEAQVLNGRPKFIDCRTLIAHGVPGAEGTPKLHGTPLSPQAWMDWQAQLSIDPAWLDRDDLPALWSEGCPEPEHNATSYPQKHPRHWPSRTPFTGAIATRAASQKWLEAACRLNRDLVGGSADLDASVLTHPGPDSQSPYLRYGVREFGMCAVANGLALGGYRPYVGTFLAFSDYAKAAIRLAAMMKLPVIYVFTHDSVGLGEDGPTHQPVEQLTGLRSIPNTELWRPADAHETYACWEEALTRETGPSILVLSRQSLPTLAPVSVDLSLGAYWLKTCEHPRLILIASGSEVSLALEVAHRLKTPVSVLSCPNLNRFRGSKLHHACQRMAPFFVLEAASSWCWGDIQPDPSYRVTLDQFGASGKGSEVLTYFGFDTEAVLGRLKILNIE